MREKIQEIYKRIEKVSNNIELKAILEAELQNLIQQMAVDEAKAEEEAYQQMTIGQKLAYRAEKRKRV